MRGSKTAGQHLSEEHLAEEQFSDLLAGGSLDSRAEAHIAGCAACQAEMQEIQEMRGALGEFRAFSTAWAEREAPRRVQVPSCWRLRLGPRPVWHAGLASAATAVVLAIGLRMPLPSAAPAAAPSATAVQADVAAPTGAELAADNRLLASIDQELSYPTQPAVPLAELKNSGREAPGRLPWVVAD